jgi:ribosome-binding factor A
LRKLLADQVGKQLRKIPELSFFVDDSLDYFEEIDRLLKKG